MLHRRSTMASLRLPLRQAMCLTRCARAALNEHHPCSHCLTVTDTPTLVTSCAHTLQAVEARRAVRRSKRPNLLGVEKQSWNQSTVVAAPLCKRATRQMSKVYNHHTQHTAHMVLQALTCITTPWPATNDCSMIAMSTVTTIEQRCCQLQPS